MCPRASRRRSPSATSTLPSESRALVLPDALAGRDVLAKSPTGSGKTLAFAVPIVERLDAPTHGRPALVLVPTRELAAQVDGRDRHDRARARPPGRSGLRRRLDLGAGQGLRDAHILVATPGRLQDLIERRIVSLDGVRILILDEADRMLDMGFQPQVDRIVARLPRKRQTMFFSATLDGEVGELARAYTTNPAASRPSCTIDQQQGEIDHHFVPVTADNKVETLAGLLAEERGLALVFVRTKRGADRLVQKLARHDVTAVAMHGDMNQSQRERALKRFEDGTVKTLVATDVAARGLDLDDITHVINFDPPEEHTALRPPRRPHRPRRPRRHRRHARPPRAAGRGQPRRADARPHRAVRERGHEGRAAAARLLRRSGATRSGARPGPAARSSAVRFARVDAAARSTIADPSLAPEGEQRIRWVAQHSPVLNRLARERLADGALRGRRVAVVVHLEAKTAYLATAARGGGRAGRRLRLEPRLDAGRDLRRARRARDRGARAARRVARTSSTPTCSPSPTRSRRSSSTTAPS